MDPNNMLSKYNLTEEEAVPAPSSTHIFDLNLDCFREIFKNLNKETLYSLTKTSKYFHDIIVYDIWAPYAKTSFNMAIETSPGTIHTPYFHEEFLDFILRHFPNVTQIRSDVFQRCTQMFGAKPYENVIYLSVENIFRTSSIVDISAFDMFPNLEHLELDMITLDFKNQRSICRLKTLSMTNSKVRNQVEGTIFKKVFSTKLESFTLRSLCFGFPINFQNLADLRKCSQLKELTLSCEYIYTTSLLDEIIDLPSLELLTIEASNDFELIDDFRIAYDAILERFCNHPSKIISKVLFKGMPTTDFFKSPYLQNMTCLGWFLSEGSIRLRETIIEWNLKTKEFIESFYAYVANSQNLMEHLVNNNYIHTRVIQKADGEHKIHEMRGRRGLTQLRIVNDNNYMHRRPNNDNESLRSFQYITARFFLDELKLSVHSTS